MSAEYSIEQSIEPVEHSTEHATEPTTESVSKPVISTPKKRHLTRDKGIQILVFWQLGMIYEAIAKLFNNISSYQVERVIHKGHPTSKKHSNWPLFITDEQSNELVAFVYASSHNHRLSWAQLPLEYPMCTWKNVSEWSITSVMRRADVSHFRISIYVSSLILSSFEDE